MDLFPEGCNLRQTSVVHDLLQFWAPFVKLPDIYASLASKGGGLKGRLNRLKQAIFQGMTIAARGCLKRKVIEEGWSRGITPEWVEITSSLKKRWCNGVARYTILRWAVNQDDDVYGLLEGALGIRSNVLTAVPKMTHFLQDTQLLPCVSGVSRHIKSPQQDIVLSERICSKRVICIFILGARQGNRLL